MKKPDRKLRILRLMLSIHESSAAYNQFSLPWRRQHDITICTYSGSEVVPPKDIQVIEGDGSLKTWLVNLRAALIQNEFDMIHVHSPHFGAVVPIVSLFLGKGRLPRVFSVHNTFDNFKFRNKLMLALSFAFCSRIVFCSHSSYESFPRFFKWLGGKNISVVQNGVDFQRIDAVVRREEMLVPPSLNATNSLSVVSIGRLIEVKNHDVVLEAFNDNCNGAGNTLEIIGEGYLANRLQAKVNGYEIQGQVELTGLIPRDEVYSRLDKADLFVSASKGEGLPVAAIEAMACRCPVVLSDIPPHREIADGVDFIPLVHPDDTAGFAREINRFELMPESERSHIAERCRKHVEERFSLSQMHDGYRKVYSEAMQP